MRGILAAALMAALALPAQADIVDSGSLIIGGQGVIGGTFTVQGNALGVAGGVSATSATLSGSGNNVFSLTTSSGIHILNGGIQWPDGTRSVSSGTASGLGNAVLSATQAWTGVNTFTSGITMANSSNLTFQSGSTVTAGPVAYSSTLAVTGRIIGQENLVAVNKGNDLSSMYFYGFSGSTIPPAGYYKVMCTGVKHTNGNIYWQVNGDTGSNYYYYLCGGNISNYCATEFSWSTANQARLSGGVETVNDGSGFRFEATFHTEKTNSIVMAPFVTTYTNGGSGGNSMNSVQGSSMWDGGSEFSSLKIYFSAGTADMYCFVKQFISGL